LAVAGQTLACAAAKPRACAPDEWAVAEWLHGRTSAPRGMERQSWNAELAVSAGSSPATNIDFLGRCPHESEHRARIASYAQRDRRESDVRKVM